MIAKRPLRYHRRGSILWQRALRRLHSKRLSDGRIAELLSSLTEADLRTLDREGWTVELAEDLSDPGANPCPWSEHSVACHRRRMGLPANRPGLEAANTRRRKLLRDRQADAGWWHLLPDASGAGWDLWHTECRVLSLLRDRGPMSRSEIEAALGRRRLRVRHNRSLFGRLLAFGLIEIVQGEDGPLFALADSAAPPERVRDTSVEAKYG